MNREDLYKAVDTIRDLLNGDNNSAYSILVKTAESQNYTLSQLDRLVNILEQVADEMP